MAKRKTKHIFKTEITQLLDLMVHSLYSNRDIFLRELISNASDALDKLRFLSLSDTTLSANDAEFEIVITPDKEAGTLTLSDNGIGMTRQELIDNIGTIASSGTKAFLEQLKDNQSNSTNLIGQFGVGFYSAFMVADTISLTSRKAGEEDAYTWVSTGSGDFEVIPSDRAEHGTSIVLKLKEDAKEYLELHTLKGLVHRYSEHVSFPIKLPEKEGEDGLETVNKADALWLQNPKEISDEDYQSFYKTVASDWDNPLTWVHSRVEGATEYAALLYLPKRAPFDLYQRDRSQGIKLYIKRVFIMEDSEGKLLPNYLRFVRGVIDCTDLPLNVSREILQDSRVIRRIRTALTKKVLDKLEYLSKNDSDTYTTLMEQFSKVLKEGVIEDPDNKERIAKLLQFSSLQHDTITLDTYIENFAEGQDTIYFLCAESKSAASNSPHLDIFKEHNVDVLLLTDQIDEWLTSHLTEFDGKNLQAANQSDVKLPGDEDDEKDTADKDADATDEAKSADDTDSPILTALKEALSERVKEVKLSTRLRQYPTRVISEHGEMSQHMQQLLKQMGQEMQDIKPILEINPDHSLICYLQEHLDDTHFNDWAHTLLDQALLAEGAHLKDPGQFVTRLNSLLNKLIS